MSKLNLRLLKIGILMLIALAFLFGTKSQANSDTTVNSFAVQLISGKDGYEKDENGYAKLYKADNNIKYDNYKVKADDFMYIINNVKYTYNEFYEWNNKLNDKYKGYWVAVDASKVKANKEHKENVMCVIYKDNGEVHYSNSDIYLTFNIKDESNSTTQKIKKGNIVKVVITKHNDVTGYKVVNGKKEVDLDAFSITVGFENKEAKDQSFDTITAFDKKFNTAPEKGHSLKWKISEDGNYAIFSHKNALKNGDIKIELTTNSNNQNNQSNQNNQIDVSSFKDVIKEKLPIIMQFIQELLEKIFSIIKQYIPTIVDTVSNGISLVASELLK